MLWGQVLFDLTEGHLDAPAVRILGDDWSRLGVDVGGEEVVVVLVACGVADDHQADGRLPGDLVPQRDAAEQQTIHGAVAEPPVGAAPLVR